MRSKDKTFLSLANKLGELSTCDRKSVGAVITRLGRCISWGYNGAPPGLPHCDENQHGYSPTEWRTQGYTDKEAKKWLKQHGCRNSTHAEANAVAFAARQGISTDGGTLYVTVFPCATCARLLLAAGIVRVVYSEVYRDSTGYDLLREGRIQTEHLTDEVPDPSL